jgi:hypothetical protein
MVSRTEPKDKRGEGMEGSVPEKERERELVLLLPPGAVWLVL